MILYPLAPKLSKLTLCPLTTGIDTSGRCLALSAMPRWLSAAASLGSGPVAPGRGRSQLRTGAKPMVSSATGCGCSADISSQREAFLRARRGEVQVESRVLVGLEPFKRRTVT